MIEVKVALGMKRSSCGYLLLQPERDGPFSLSNVSTKIFVTCSVSVVELVVRYAGVSLVFY